MSRISNFFRALKTIASTSNNGDGIDLPEEGGRDDPRDDPRDAPCGAGSSVPARPAPLQCALRVVEFPGHLGAFACLTFSLSYFFPFANQPGGLFNICNRFKLYTGVNNLLRVITLEARFRCSAECGGTYTVYKTWYRHRQTMKPRVKFGIVKDNL